MRFPFAQGNDDNFLSTKAYNEAGILYAKNTIHCALYFCFMNKLQFSFGFTKTSKIIDKVISSRSSEYRDVVYLCIVFVCKVCTHN